MSNHEHEQNGGKKWDYVEKTEQQEQEAQELKDSLEKSSADASAEIDGELLAEYTNLSEKELIKRLIKAEQEAKKNWEELLRAKAETQNIMSSADREKQNIRNFAIKSFVQSLIGVIDNFERSLELTEQKQAADINVSALIEGIELTRKDFLSMLEKFGVEVLHPLHEKFDPQYHEAMSSIPSGEHEPNHVLQVLQKGYTLNKRLVRPAMVVVSKKTDE